MRRGVTLTETILSVFVLTAGMLLVVNLLHTSLRYQSQIEERALGARLARLTLARVRAWAWENSGGAFNFYGNWAPYAGTTSTDPAYPGFTIRVDADPTGRALFSPCSTLEQTYASLPRRLTRAVVPVRVRVERPGSDPVILVSYVGAPPVTLQPLTVTLAGGATPLAQDATVTLAVSASDGSGTSVDGLAYSWSVEPTGTTPALGTLVVDTDGDGRPDMPRDGSQIVFQHRYRKPDGVTYLHKDGQCKVIARTRHHGRDVTGEIVLDLQPGPLP
ncbi:MAG: hypothetical protein AB1758_07260 [Candidatus Eremiobacterota bacterium]